MSLCRKYSGPACDEEETPARGPRHEPLMPVSCERCNCKVWNPEQHERWHRYANT